jgi:tRNA pseudouridine synthase 10
LLELGPDDLSKARTAAGKGLCDHCLGRLFGKIGTGMGNDERGSEIRRMLSADADDGPCSLCDDVFDVIDRLAEAAAERIAETESENFLIGSRIDPGIVRKEEELWKELGTENAEPIKSELNREIGKRVFAILGRKVEFKNPQVVACVDTGFADVTLDIAPIFIYGRYTKLSREIPQTIWPCRVCKGKGCPRCKGTGKMYQTSVQEIIGDIAVEMSGGKEHFFHGMGREDIDAVMIGTGRPFVLEISSPRIRDIDLDVLERRANASDLAGFSGLCFTDRDSVQRVKLATPTKVYRVRVRANGKVNKERVIEVSLSFKDRSIDQRTPARVEHRRADLVRRRRIHWVEADVLSDEVFDLTLKTESGTYVKEFVSGDSGRSTPSFSEVLGIQCVVETLDVLSVDE